MKATAAQRGVSRSASISVIVMAEAIAVSAGSNHTCALTTTGGIRCWGFTAFYIERFGGTSYGSATPVDVIGLTGEVAILSAGGGRLHAHSASVIGPVSPPFAGGPSCVVTAQGGVKCWDWLGDGLTSGAATVSVSVGGGRICAVTAAGGVKCWELSGEWGDATTRDRGTLVDVVGLTSGVAAVSLGSGHTCAVTTVGGVKCWGENDRGQLGDGTTADITTPSDVVGLKSGVATVSAGRRHTCAVTTEGRLECWGSNFSGQLGDGTTTDRTTPVDVVGLTSGVVTVSAGSSQTCAVTTAGGVKCWGSNGSGQLGDGTTTNRATPVDVVGLTSGVATVSAGSSHTCAVTTAGGVKCWGNGFSGRLGDGTELISATPVDVIGLVADARSREATPTATPTPTPNGPLTIVADPLDFEVYGDGTAHGPDLGDLAVGDTGPGIVNLGRRGVLRFNLSDLAGERVQSAVLNLTLAKSRKDQYPAPGIIDNSPPFINPGLGDTIVVHIADYAVPNGGIYVAPSIGNDPGVLIPAGVEPGSVVSIDMARAMQQALDAGSSFVAFRIQTAVETDGDDLNDQWFFWSADYQNVEARPVIEYSLELPGATPDAVITTNRTTPADVIGLPPTPIPALTPATTSTSLTANFGPAPTIVR